jgi:hypothetical protein
MFTDRYPFVKELEPLVVERSPLATGLTWMRVTESNMSGFVLSLQDNPPGPKQVERHHDPLLDDQSRHVHEPVRQEVKSGFVKSHDCLAPEEYVTQCFALMMIEVTHRWSQTSRAKGNHVPRDLQDSKM